MPGGDLASNLYGSAEQAAQTQGQGLAQGAQAGVQNYHAGAQLAIEQQKLDMAQQQMQAHMQELKQAKIQKNYDFLANAHQYTNGQDRNNYIQAGMGLRDASGLTNADIPDNVYKGMGTDDQMGRDVTARQMVEGGIMTPQQYFKAKADQQAWSQIPVASPESYNMADTDVMSAIKDVAERQSAAQKAQLEVQASKNNKEATFAHEDYTKAASEMTDFGKMVANSSTRSVLGTTKAMVDAADSVKQLTDSKLPANATKEQRVAAYNNLTTQQQNEVISGMDRMLSRGNPTVAGKEGLTPPTTPQELMAKYGQILGNVPVGANKGEFIDNMMGTINRERKMNADKFASQTEQLKMAHTMARKVFGDKMMDDMINASIKNPGVGGDTNGTSGGFKAPNGKTYSADTLKTFINNPANANDPLFSWAKQQVGGG